MWSFFPSQVRISSLWLGCLAWWFRCVNPRNHGKQRVSLPLRAARHDPGASHEDARNQSLTRTGSEYTNGRRDTERTATGLWFGFLT